MIPNIKVFYLYWHTGSWIDITQHIIPPLKFYYQKRNNDYSLVLNDINLNLKKNAFLSPPAYYDNGNFKVRIEVNNIIRWTGYIYEFSLNKTKQCWEVNCHSHLYKLKEIDASINLSSIILNGTPQQYYEDPQGYKYIQILWLLKSIFYQSNLGLDISNAENYIYSDGIYYKQLKLDLNMAMCLNQPDSLHRLKIINPPPTRDYNANRLNGFELVSYLCSVFGFSIVPSGSEYFTLYRYRNPANRNYTTDDSEIYDYEEEVVDNEWDSTRGFAVNYTVGSSEDTGAIALIKERPYYYNTATVTRPRNVRQLVVGEGRETLDLKKHFLIVIETGNYNPPLHNLVETIPPGTVSIMLTRPKFFKHKIQKLKRRPDFSKPCILENMFVLDSSGYFCEIKQDTLTIPSFDQ